MWGVRCSFGMDPTLIQFGDIDLPSMLRRVQDQPFHLVDFGWFRCMMKHWKGGQGQADAAEFQHLLLQTLDHPELLFKWEKRLIKTENPFHVKIMDYTQFSNPIVLQFTSDHPPTMPITLGDLLKAWGQDWSMQSALTKAWPMVSIQIDRFYMDAQQCLQKHFTAVTDTQQCNLQVFATEALDVINVSYTMVACLLHIGQVGSGHYRAKLRVGGDAHHATWAITDDDLHEWPNWAPSALTMIWMCRTDNLGLMTNEEAITKMAATQSNLSDILSLVS